MIKVYNYILLFFLMTTILSCKRSFTSLNGFKTDSLTTVEFIEPNYNFGVVQKRDTLWHTFLLKNTGKANLIVTKIEVSCGCSYPDYPQKPILPNKTDSIRVRYSVQNKIGRQLTTLKFFMNTDPEIHEISVESNIVERIK